MASETYNITIEKGTDFSIALTLLRSDGTPINIADTGICVQSDIVEFYGCPPCAQFSITESSASGVLMSLPKSQSSLLPFGGAYYSVILNESGVTEGLMSGYITTKEAATFSRSCQ